MLQVYDAVSNTIWLPVQEKCVLIECHEIIMINLEPSNAGSLHLSILIECEGAAYFTGH